MTPTQRGMRDLLENAGARRTPAPRADFVSELEARLLAEPTPTRASATFGGVAPSRARRAPALVAAAVAVAALGLVGVLVVRQDEPSHPRVSLASATDTVVELPNGTQVPGHEGLKLPDGAIVRTGPDGHAAVGNVDLGPGQVAVVDEGRIKIEGPEVTIPPVAVPTFPNVTAPPVPGLPTP